MPNWKALLASRLAGLKLSPAREREIIDEVSQHLDDRYQELTAAGVAPEAAVRLALDEIDEEDLLAREMRTLRQVSMREPIVAGAPSRRWLTDVRQDVVYAFRTLRKNPGFTAAAVITLALGIGANSAIFSLVNATLLQRLPVQNRERLVYVFNGAQWNVLSYPGYRTLRDGSRLLDGLAAWGGIGASMNVDGETDLVSGVIVTGNFFDVLGLSSSRGRLLSISDDITPMGHPVVVISHDLWKTRFAGREDIVGNQMRLNGTMFTIVGVTPEGFIGPQLGVVRDIYVPMMMQPLMRPPRAGYSGEMNPDLLKNPDNSWLFQVALPKSGVAPEQAQAELSAIQTIYMRGRNPKAREVRLSLVPVDTGDATQRSQMRSAAALLISVTGVVLLIACANVANLLLSKAAARRREVAIRLALGASRWRIVRQLLTESVVLSLLGGGGGLFLAWLVIRGFEAAPPPSGALPIVVDFALDSRVLLFSMALSLLTGLVFGLAPAMQSSHPTVVPALKDEAFVAEGRPRRFDLKKTLVVVEVALSLVLLIAAGLFIKSLRTVQSIDAGFPTDKLLSAPLNIQLLRYTSTQGREFYRRAVERMEQIPGVSAATVARIGLLDGRGRIMTIAVEGRLDSGSRGQSEGRGDVASGERDANANVVGTGFFKTIGVPILRGRDFDAQDDDNAPLVAIINETMAKKFFPGEDPLGKRFATGFSRTGQPAGDWFEIVGIARDSKYSTLTEPPIPVVYFPIAQRHETGVTLYVRATDAVGSVIAQMRRELQAIEPNLPVSNVATMAETIGMSLYVPRMGAMLLAVFGGLALMLASLGVYGVLAFSISRRTREIGIRVALGADRHSVLGLVVREGMKLVAIGLVLGLGIGFYASESLARFLFNVNPRDIVTFVVVPIVLVVVALLACYLPARRALRVDPMVALRDA